jgi:hypothetical protein
MLIGVTDGDGGAARTQSGSVSLPHLATRRPRRSLETDDAVKEPAYSYRASTNS